MAVEEVVLSVPGDPEGHRDPAAAGSPPDTPEALDKAVRDYFRSARARDAFVLGERMRRRRQERFELALKTLVKTMATDVSRQLPERSVRLDVRTQVYTSMMMLARAMAGDHLIVIRRARRTMRWALAVATAGALAFLYSLMASGWLSIGAPVDW